MNKFECLKVAADIGKAYAGSNGSRLVEDVIEEVYKKLCELNKLAQE